MTKEKKTIKVRDLKPSKDAKGGGHGAQGHGAQGHGAQGHGAQLRRAQLHGGRRER